MKKFIFVPFLLLLSIVFIGCSLNLPSVCDNLQEPSDLCNFANSRNMRLEDFENGIIILNSIAIGEGVYSKEQAKEVITDLKGVISTPISWLFFKTALEDKINKYPGLFIVAESYLSVMTSESYLKEYDVYRLNSLFDRMISFL